MTVLIINTDGACHGNPGPGGWAAFWERDGKTVELLGGAAATTNNRMELEGPTRALALLLSQGFDGEILLRTDSQYVIKGVTEWRKGWERRGWRTAGGDAVKNLELWKALYAEVDRLGTRLKWQWVKGHNGDPGNERADGLAQEGLQMSKTKAGAWQRQDSLLLALA